LNKYVVYTSVFGKYDKFPYIEKEEGIDYILFTPEEIKSDNMWNVIKVDREFKDDSKNSRIYKLLPHLFLSSYEQSCWVDADLKFEFKLLNLFKSFKYFLCFCHPNKVLTYQEEGRRCISKNKETKEKIEHQIEFYSKFNIDTNFKKILAGFFLMRSHNNTEVIRFNNEWFSHIASMGKRDQISLEFLRNKYFPFFNIDTIDSNYIIKKIGHRLRK